MPQQSKFLLPHPGKQTAMILIIATLICVSLVLSRNNLTGAPGFKFLLWNLFLAWIPFLLSSLLESKFMSKMKWYLKLPVAGLWLLFYPNAPYILTDLVHLKPLINPAYWYDFTLMIFFLFTSLFLTFASLIQIKRYLDRYMSSLMSHSLMLCTLFLTSVGVCLGRFERYNSWDFFLEPVAVMKDAAIMITGKGNNQISTGVTLGFAVFLILNYFTLHSLTGNLTAKKRKHHEKV